MHMPSFNEHNHLQYNNIYKKVTVDVNCDTIQCR